MFLPLFGVNGEKSKN